MTVIIDGSNGLTFPDVSIQATSATNATNISAGTLPFARLPTGSVLQVVQSSYTNATTTTSTSYVTTGILVTITPKFSTSKILVMHQGMINTQGSAYWGYYTLYRGGSNLNGSVGSGGLYINGGTDNHVPTNLVFLDSPATSSATTYTVYIKSSSGSSVRYNSDGWSLNIVALEIAA